MSHVLSRMYSNEKTSVLVFCFLLLVTILSSGCSFGLKPDTSLLTDDPCAAPCWHNIVPGVSKEKYIRSQLENSPFVRTNTLEYELTEINQVPLAMFGWQAHGKNINRVYLRDDQVLWIEIALDYDLTLGDVVDKYGPPEGIYVFVGTADFDWYNIRFHYPEIGLTLESFSLVDPKDTVGGKILLSESIKITDAQYYAPASLQSVLGEVFFLTPEQVEQYIINTQSWQGFGHVQIAE
ncbi:MAG: hypothetical protein GY832_19965 [Chloroflexi bacterium]|nr:hypothetical protein [Chloroflexota bacterium]